MKKRGLGRGLKELLGETDVSVESVSQQNLNIDSIIPGSSQPRGEIKDEPLQELAASIREQGLLQPIVVRKVQPNKKFGQRYEIIAGERRWRACKLADLKEIPVVIKNVNNQTAVALALIENLQRENLNVLEQAEGISRLINEFNLTHIQAAKTLGKSRASVSNLLRLLSAPSSIKVFLKEGVLEQGHVRALLPLPVADQVALSTQVKNNSHSVMWVEQKVKLLLENNHPNRKKINGKNSKSLDARKLENVISEHLNLKVRLREISSQKGEIKIAYNTVEEFQGFLEKLKITH